MSAMIPESRPGVRLLAVQGDITEQVVDAVVNAANPTLLGGEGVDGAIHRRGGPEILAECRRIRGERFPAGLPTGEAVPTTAGLLPARRVIHTVGPVWRGGRHGEPDALRSAYRRSLEVAREEGLKSVAFPAISTGAYGFPKRPAAEIAVQVVRAFSGSDPAAFDEIRFILFSAADLELYREVLRLAGTGR